MTAPTLAPVEFADWPTTSLVARLRSVRAELELSPDADGPAMLRRLRQLSTELDDVSALIAGLCAAPQEGPEVVVDAPAFSATVDGIPLALAFREFRLLQALVEHPGKVLTRARLMALAWDVPAARGNLRTVDVHVRRLRVRLGAAAGHVVTVRQVGYRWE
jgi:DNA-binding response OmpR family regulator